MRREAVRVVDRALRHAGRTVGRAAIAFRIPVQPTKNDDDEAYARRRF